MIDKATMNQAWNNVVVDTKQEDIKEILNKINIEENYDKNCKILNQFDVKILRDTLIYLRSIDEPTQLGIPNIEELLKSGIMHEIICCISRIVPYLCHICNVIVDNKKGNTHMRCVSCGVRACDCYKGRSTVLNFICSCCTNLINKIKTIPDSRQQVNKSGHQISEHNEFLK